MAKRKRTRAAAQAAPEASPEAAVAPESALVHEIITLVLPLLPVAQRVRCAAVCRAWRDASASPSVWTELDFRGGGAAVDTLALAALCRRAGAALRALHLDAAAALSTLSAASILYALQAGGACAGLQSLMLPAPVNECFDYEAYEPDELVLRPAQVAALHAACPALRVAACGVLCKSNADAAVAAATLPGPLVLCFTRSWCDESDGNEPFAAPPHWLAPSVASMLLVGGPDGAEMAGRPTDADVTRLADALRAAPSCSLRQLDVISEEVGPEGAAALAELLGSERCTLQSLLLDTANLTDSGGAAVARGLSINTSLLTLRLRGIGAFDLATGLAVAAALRQNTTLRVLNLEAWLDDAAMLALAYALHDNSTLQGLWLMNMSPELGTAGIAALAAVLLPGSGCRVSTLWLTVCRPVRCALIAAVCDAAKERGGAPALAKLRVEGLGEDADDGAPLPAGARWLDSLCAMLRANSTLTELELPDLIWSDKGLAALAGALRDNGTLHKLDLTSFLDVTCKNAGMAALAAALTPPSRAATSLTSLHLGGLRAGEAGARALCAMLRENSALRTLHAPRTRAKGIFVDEDITFAAVPQLCAALRVNRTLKQLSFGCNGLSGDAVALNSALAHNRSLKFLEVSGVQLDCGGAAALATGLRTNTHLRELCLQALHLSGTALYVLAGAVSRTRSLMRLEVVDPNGMSCTAAVALSRAACANDCASALVALKLNSLYEHTHATCAAELANRLPFETVLL